MDEKTKNWMRQRARPMQRKTVTLSKKKQSSSVKGAAFIKAEDDKHITISLRAGACPCGECDHQWMWQCYEADCQCCSGSCT